MVLINGEPGECVPVSDRGLAFGDGVFRTLECIDGVPRLWRWQYARLCADASALSLVPPAEGLLLAELAQASTGLARSVAKITLTRGSGPRGYAPSPESCSSRIVSASAWAGYPQQLGQQGIQMMVCGLRLARQPRLAGIKHLNRLENVLARSEWNDPAIREGLLLDSQGEVIEGTMSNLFLLRDGQLQTPWLDQCGVSGAVRAWIMQQESVECVRISLPQLLAADEVFVCNSLAGIWPVASLAGRHWDSFPVAQRLSGMLALA